MPNASLSAPITASEPRYLSRQFQYLQNGIDSILKYTIAKRDVNPSWVLVQPVITRK